MLQSPTVGVAPWSPALDENIGRAGLFVPPDHGMPGDGVVALSEALSPVSSQWLMCEVSLEEVRRVRQEGQVFTRRDWPEQFDRICPL